MFCKGYQENKSNDLRNDLETDYRILTGEIIIEKLNVEDLLRSPVQTYNGLNFD